MPRRTAVGVRRRPKTARTAPSTESRRARLSVSENRRAGRSGEARPAARREPTEFERAASRAYDEGRREQRCPACGRGEAGGGHCSGCYRPVHPDEWTAVEWSEAQRAARRRENDP